MFMAYLLIWVNSLERRAPDVKTIRHAPRNRKVLSCTTDASTMTNEVTNNRLKITDFMIYFLKFTKIAKFKSYIQTFFKKKYKKVTNPLLQLV